MSTRRDPAIWLTSMLMMAPWVVAACGDESGAVEGSGTIVTEERDVEAPARSPSRGAEPSSSMSVTESS